MTSSTKHTLAAAKRVLTGKKVKQLRAQNMLPGNVFGETDSVSIQVDTKTFKKIYGESGETSVVYLSIEGEKKDRPVLVSSVSRDPITGELLHADFQQVNLSEAITANIPLEVEGESPAVKAGNVLLKLRDELEVEALPTDLPEKFVLSVVGLTEVGQELKVSDLSFDRSKVKIALPEEEALVLIQEAKEEVEEVAPAEVAEVEITTAKKPEEGEEAAAGEQPKEQKKEEK